MTRVTTTLEDDQAEYLQQVKAEEDLDSDAAALRVCVERAAMHEDAQQRATELEARAEELRNELQAANRRIDSANEIVEYVEEEKSLEDGWEPARSGGCSAWTTAKPDSTRPRVVDRVDRPPLAAPDRATTRLRFPLGSSDRIRRSGQGIASPSGPVHQAFVPGQPGPPPQPIQAFVPRGPGRIPAVGRPPGSRPSRPGQSGGRSPLTADAAGSSYRRRAIIHRQPAFTTARRGAPSRNHRPAPDPAPLRTPAGLARHGRSAPGARIPLPCEEGPLRDGPGRWSTAAERLTSTSPESVGMSSDTMRPHLAAELADAVREHVRIPPNRLSVGDRIRVLLEEYHDATERVGSLENERERREQQIDQFEAQLAKARNQGGALST